MVVAELVTVSKHQKLMLSAVSLQGHLELLPPQHTQHLQLGVSGPS